MRDFGVCACLSLHLPPRLCLSFPQEGPPGLWSIVKYGKSKHACDRRGPPSPAQARASQGSYSAAHRMDR